MKLWLLSRQIPYEGEDPLGIYSSVEKAQQASASYFASKDGRGTFPIIVSFEVDADPSRVDYADQITP